MLKELKDLSIKYANRPSKIDTILSDLEKNDYPNKYEHSFSCGLLYLKYKYEVNLLRMNNLRRIITANN